jgi:hypothetical protein
MDHGPDIFSLPFYTSIHLQFFPVLYINEKTRQAREDKIRFVNHDSAWNYNYTETNRGLLSEYTHCWLFCSNAGIYPTAQNTPR